MAAIRHVAVIDIGKTNAKLALVDLEDLSEVAVRKMPNRPLAGGPYPHHDIEALWSFILDGLSALGREHPVDAISLTTHGATAALVGAAGDLVLPVLDYEHDGPDGLREEYEAVRSPFAETGSPKLPNGLNLGAQLFWLERTFPDAFGRVHAVLTYPQFWGYRLTGIAAGEVTSLGCHSDLWNPRKRDYASLVDRMAWRALFPPLRRADAVLGPILPDVVNRTGLDPATPVVCGIHDSNASLLPHLITRNQPFAVVSTGTWVIAMAVGGDDLPLDPARDTLINVNAHGDPVPSARFMGGREFERVMEGAGKDWRENDLRAVLSEAVMLLPSVEGGTGPYPDRQGGWTGAEPVEGRRFVAASFYLALMTATCLDLVGARGQTVVEGPFAANRPYLSMLSAATGRPVVVQDGGGTGTSLGAALLAGMPGTAPPSAIIGPTGEDEALRRYAKLWKEKVACAGR
ncbi:FGGY-family carbohydrate kinase [Chelativorans sp. M5D2P16]|uniref:FGGY-family carbohydrate kinase n=1 Tax=Chelativorans sp. M5D2P16 TaxID=3095678 RepID=UPI002ACA950E|nr:FGGY-family carbohydrate kinase [Chelativorans sp. M5D2P16]MDZ5699684.1 FGGY-family carbohydrate kinase [Chelativorans sp. M5D2P16]